MVSINIVGFIILIVLAFLGLALLFCGMTVTSQENQLKDDIAQMVRERSDVAITRHETRLLEELAEDIERFK